MTHEKSFVTFYMDTHFQNHCMIFTMHDSLQVASDSVSSSLLQFFDPLCSFLFLVILNLSLNCFQFKRILLSSPPLYWGWQTWAGYWHFVIVRLITLGHDKSILNWCRCNLVVSWVWNQILQRDFKIFIRIRVNGSSKEFVKVHRISHLWINRIRTSQFLDPFCNGDGNEHL